MQRVVDPPFPRLSTIQHKLLATIEPRIVLDRQKIRDTPPEAPPIVFRWRMDRTQDLVRLVFGRWDLDEVEDLVEDGGLEALDVAAVLGGDVVEDWLECVAIGIACDQILWSLLEAY